MLVWGVVVLRDGNVFRRHSRPTGTAQIHLTVSTQALMELVQSSAFVSAISAITLTAAFTDFRTHKLPNWLTVSAFIAGVVFHSVWGQGLAFSLQGFALGFGILFVLFLIGGGGGGDVKLMGAVGAWLGWLLTLEVYFLTALLVALVSVVAMAYHLATKGWTSFSRNYLRRSDVNDKSAPAAEGRKRSRGRPVPYAVPIAVSTWLVLLWHAVK